MKKHKILSLDISSVSTGWCFLIDDKIKEYGIIKINSNKFDKFDRLLKFREELLKVLTKYKPEHIIIENGFFGRNIKTLKLLSNFIGVGIECCYSITGVKPYIMANTTPKSHFGVRSKEDLFNKVVKIYKLSNKHWKFDTHNDITDAIAQGMCYYDTEVNVIWRE